MGFLIDSSVLIAAEREAGLDGLSAPSDAGVAIAAITASELLHGVHRADSAARRRKRQRFVDELLEGLPVVAFDLDVARVHAALWADLSARGRLIGAHDLIIAATALAHDLTVATRNIRHFQRVEGLSVTVW